MAEVETAHVKLACCGTGYQATFKHADAPGFPLNRFRANVECPSCDRLVILTLTLDGQGAQSVTQEVID
jgi:hypothetical protein